MNELHNQELPNDAYNQVSFLVPSFHCNAHGINCIRRYHVERNPCAGLCDGEASERIWSQLIKIDTIVRNQAEENRILQIEDQLWHVHERSDTIQFIQSIFKKRSELVQKLVGLRYSILFFIDKLEMHFSV